MLKKAKKIKIFMIAGEPSGDLLGGRLISALKKKHKGNIEFIGIGGDKMLEGGLKTFFPMKELSVMGIFEVIPHIPRLLRRIRQTASLVISTKPDVVITIDAPDFCFRVMKKVKKLEAKEIAADKTNGTGKNNHKHPKKVHVIAPSVWAYRPKRAKKISKLYDHLLVVLPFEPPFFEKYGLKSTFIGHPVVESDFERLKKQSPFSFFGLVSNDNEVGFRERYKIPENNILLALTPGSRVNEIKKLLPIFFKTVQILNKKHNNLSTVVITLPKFEPLVKEEVNNFGLFDDVVIVKNEMEKILALNDANVALAKSGTNTFEVMIAKVPMVVTYKLNPLTYWLGKMIVSIKFGNLVNIIRNKEIVPEMMQGKCRPDLLAEKIEYLVHNPDVAKQQVEECGKVLKELGYGDKKLPSDKAAEVILGLVE